MSNRKQTRHERCKRPVSGKMNFCLSQIKRAVNVLGLLATKSYKLEKMLSFVPVRSMQQHFNSSRLFSFLFIAWLAFITSACGADDTGKEYLGTLSITLAVMAVIIAFMLITAKRKARQFDKKRPNAGEGETKNTADQGRPGTRT